MADTLVQTNLEKISSFLQDVQYRSLMINSANYNVRLMRERKTRLPFLDSQTGIAQNPCKLYMSARHRMPGTVEGQLYVYPSQRWCCRKRSYMALAHQHWLLKKAIKEPEGDEHTIVTVENPAAVNTEETTFVYETKVAEPFYFDETAFLEDEEEEPDDDDDDTYSTRATPTRKRKKAPKIPKPVKTPGSRGRRKKEPQSKTSVEGDEETPGKPYECQLCGARYKTRQGLSYHLSHTHKGGRANSGGGRSRGGGNNPPTPRADPASAGASYQPQAYQSDALAGLAEFQDSYLGYLSAGQDASPTGRSGSSSTSNSSRRSSGGGGGGGTGAVTPALAGNGGGSCTSRGTKGSNSGWSGLANVGSPSTMMPTSGTPTSTSETLREASPASLAVPDLDQQQLSKPPKVMGEKNRAQPSPYCDFCLGDATMNKKTGESEELVSCSDCGRSGHPTCLQFTAHMMISVRQYRWQCIECKCCTLCGTSENDDQLLFCDDCDRGYHLYCLRPPLQEPPEGEWSCDLCLQQFHSK
ncbi:zinc finger protein ubi-d4 B-like isoform X2 [Homarus americanus]|uniref:zinc finger protein ubi-d4 B-like isoform X2 n=1 Tax=Homarus americanus TaxID=6706 RepID=UPI001C479EC3|nr:zinc finger protein ubi-d4 B-like isoform X2 [Homarus americanus]